MIKQVASLLRSLVGAQCSRCLQLGMRSKVLSGRGDEYLSRFIFVRDAMCRNGARVYLLCGNTYIFSYNSFWCKIDDYL